MVRSTIPLADLGGARFRPGGGNALPPGLLAHLRPLPARPSRASSPMGNARPPEATARSPWVYVRKSRPAPIEQLRAPLLRLGVAHNISCYGPLLISVWMDAGLLYRSQTWGERVSALGAGTHSPQVCSIISGLLPTRPSRPEVERADLCGAAGGGRALPLGLRAEESTCAHRTVAGTSIELGSRP